MTQAGCRCGWDGVDDHLCHRCHAKPGKRRFYGARTVALAGHGLKVEASSTWGCDECWEAWQSAGKEAPL